MTPTTKARVLRLAILALKCGLWCVLGPVLLVGFVACWVVGQAAHERDFYNEGSNEGD